MTGNCAMPVTLSILSLIPLSSLRDAKQGVLHLQCGDFLALARPLEGFAHPLLLGTQMGDGVCQRIPATAERIPKSPVIGPCAQQGLAVQSATGFIRGASRRVADPLHPGQARGPRHLLKA
jgi:hypothetical protein